MNNRFSLVTYNYEYYHFVCVYICVVCGNPPPERPQFI